MNRQQPILFIVVLALIGVTAGALAHTKANQKLGLPGVKTRPLPNSQNLEVLLPEAVPGYTSRGLAQGATVTNLLPQDTSFGTRIYTATDGFQILVNAVLMGSSRASIHKPQICLTGQGWTIDAAASREESIRLDKPVPYDLPVMRLIGSREVTANGRTVSQRGQYVYWFVDADRCTASHSRRMLWSVHDVVVKSELDRWAYIGFFSICSPGQEAAAYERMKQLMVASVPEFQLVPQVPLTSAAK